MFNNPDAKHGDGLLHAVLEKVDEFRPPSKFSSAVIPKTARKMKSRFAIETPQQLKDEMFSLLQDSLRKDLFLSEIFDLKTKLQLLEARVDKAATNAAQAEWVKKATR